MTENSALYAQAEGGHVRELTYDKGGALRSLDVSLLATHLFDYHSIVDMALPKARRRFYGQCAMMACCWA